jgi:hypothetical protein
VDEEVIDLSGEIVIVEGAEWIDDDPPLVRLHSGAISRLVESEPEDEPETDDDDSADDDTSPDEEPGDDDNVLCGLTAGDCTFGVSLATVCPSLSLLGVYRRRHWATLR